jgi:hypothetical protein
MLKDIVMPTDISCAIQDLMMNPGLQIHCPRRERQPSSIANERQMCAACVSLQRVLLAIMVDACEASSCECG